jgi:hypothetical protein
MNPDNLYFIDTPVEIQDESFNDIIEQLNFIDNDNIIVYVIFSKIYNFENKGFFKCYIRTEIESCKENLKEPDFLIFSR